jgi:acyl-CoA dehydrogenase
MGVAHSRQRNSVDMPVDFDVAPELRDLQDRIRSFIAEQIIPQESDARCTPHGPTDALRRELIAKARAAGLLAHAHWPGDRF